MFELYNELQVWNFTLLFIVGRSRKHFLVISYFSSNPSKNYIQSYKAFMLC